MIRSTETFNQFPFEQATPRSTAPPAATLLRRGLGLLEEQRPRPRVVRQELPLALASGPFLLGGSGILAIPKPGFEPTGASLVLGNVILEDVSGGFLVSIGREIGLLAVETERQAELRPYVVSLRNLIEREQIAAARRMLNALPLRFLDYPEIKRLRKALVPPTVRKTEKRDVDRTIEYDWMRANSQAYRGQWVALAGGRPVAAATSLRDLREQLKALGLKHPPLIHRIQ